MNIIPINKPILVRITALLLTFFNLKYSNREKIPMMFAKRYIPVVVPKSIRRKMTAIIAEPLMILRVKLFISFKKSSWV